MILMMPVKLKPTKTLFFVLALSLALSSCESGGSSDGSGDSSVANPQSNQPIDVSATSCAFSVPAEPITIPTTMVNTDSVCDYYLSGDLRVNSNLTIEPGTTIVVAKDARISIREGALNAVGTANKRITIRGENPIMGWWQGIIVYNDTPSRIEYVDIIDGGNATPAIDEFRGGLNLRRTETSLINISVSNSFVDGVRIDRDSVITAFSNNRFFGNRLAGIKMAGDFVPVLDVASDYIGEDAPNGNPYVHIMHRGSSMWKNLNAPYYLEGFLSAGEDEQITVMPGVQLLVDGGSVWAYSNAVIRFEGTEAEPISIKPSNGQAGGWLGLSASATSELYISHTEIDGAESGVSVSEGSRVEISNSAIINSSEWGIDCDSGTSFYGPSALIITGDMRYENNDLGDIDEQCVVQ